MGLRRVRPDATVDLSWLLAGLGYGALIGWLTGTVIVAWTTVNDEFQSSLLADIGPILLIAAVYAAPVGAVIGGLAGLVLSMSIPWTKPANRQVAAFLLALTTTVVLALGVGLAGGVAIEFFVEGWWWEVPALIGANLMAWRAHRLDART